MSKRGSAVSYAPPAGVKKPKIDSGFRDERTGQGIVLDPDHKSAIHVRPAWVQTIMTPAPPTGALNNTAYFSFILENTSAGVLEDNTLRFSVTFTTTSGSQPTDSRVMPVTHWFERIEFYDRLTGTEISRKYADMLHLSFNTLPTEALERIADMINMDPRTGRETGRTFAKDETHYFYLPLIHSWLNGMDLDLSTLRGDLEIRFYPKGGNFGIFQNDQTALGVPCSTYLNEIRLISGCHVLPNGLRLSKHPSKLGKVHEQHYIDYVQYADFGNVMVPNQEYRFDLDQFSHNSGALFVYFRKSGSQAGYNDGAVTYTPMNQDRVFTCDSLGDDTTIDLEDVNGRSNLGEGTPINERYFREHTLGELVNHSFLKHNNVYCIPFSNDLPGMMDGGMNGFKIFKGDRERLVVRTGAQPVSSTISFTYGGLYSTSVPTIATNTLRLFVTYKGVSVAILEAKTGNTFTQVSNIRYTSPATGGLTNLNTILAKNAYLKSQGIKITFANTRVGATAADVESDTGSIYTATITTLDGQPVAWPRDDFYQLKLTAQSSSTNAVEDLVPGTPVKGKRGFISGVYDVFIYSAFFRFLHERAGTLDVAAA